MSGYTIKVDNPVYPKGQTLFVTDLPVELVNGETVDVPADAADAYKASHPEGLTILQALKGDAMYEVHAAKGSHAQSDPNAVAPVSSGSNANPTPNELAQANESSSPAQKGGES